MVVYLAGFMASGKSTVGPRLADALGADFLDLDALIEEQAEKTIPEIFAEEGEMGFRQRETKALWTTGERSDLGTDLGSDLVVALGGGTIVDDANRAFAKEHGLVVTLKVEPETVLDRLGDDAGERPMLQDDDGEPLPRQEMADRVRTLLSIRRSAYADADLVVDADDRPPDTLAAMIAEAAEAWGRR
jgi:shikimate kinase